MVAADTVGLGDHLTGHELQNKAACHRVQRPQDSAGGPKKRGPRLLVRPPGKQHLNMTPHPHKTRRATPPLPITSETYFGKLLINTFPPISTRRFPVPTGPYHKKQRHRNPGIRRTAPLALRPYIVNVGPTQHRGGSYHASESLLVL